MNQGLAEPAPGDALSVGLPQGATLHTQIAMNGEPLQRTVTIKDPQGFHLRPAAAFAKRASQFQSIVTLRLNDRSVNGKSPMDLLLLAAEPGSQIVLEVAGEDAPAAMDVLAELIEAVMNNGGDDAAGPPPKG